jgi:hypothetical protein
MVMRGPAPGRQKYGSHKRQSDKHNQEFDQGERLGTIFMDSFIIGSPGRRICLASRMPARFRRKTAASRRRKE